MIGKKLGQYELLELIGRGGMATVYRARQPSMDRDVAIKVLEEQLTTSHEFLKRFLRETRAIAQMSHAHIVKVYDFGEQEGIVYLAMELLRGGSLADQIAAGPMPLPLAQRVLDQVASALDYAHAKGIIHRDLKPQNILFDDAGNAFLTDFGIVKVMDETSKLTETGSVVGTPAYMSPEQWTGGPWMGGRTCTRWACALYEMLTGHVPFQGETLYSMMQLHLNELPAPVHTVRKDLSPRYAQILDKALAKNPDLRYSKAGDVAAAFADAVSAPSAAAPSARCTKPRLRSCSRHARRRPRQPSRRRRAIPMDAGRRPYRRDSDAVGAARLGLRDHALAHRLVLAAAQACRRSGSAVHDATHDAASRGWRAVTPAADYRRGGGARHRRHRGAVAGLARRRYDLAHADDRRCTGGE